MLELLFKAQNTTNTKPWIVFNDFFDSSNLILPNLGITEFHTHGVGNSNLWNLSMRFADFKYYITTIANKYGAKGNEVQFGWHLAGSLRIFMASRPNYKFIATQNGKYRNKCELPEIPRDFSP